MTLQQALSKIKVLTHGEGFFSLNDSLNNWLSTTGLHKGVLHLTCLHTSASLTINENADTRVLKDLSAWMEAVVPQDGKGPLDGLTNRTPYLHIQEGFDDMPAHIRTALTNQTLTVSVEDGKLLLGTWQDIYLWEHRSKPHERIVSCHLLGETVKLTPKESQKKFKNTLLKNDEILLNSRVHSSNNNNYSMSEIYKSNIEMFSDKLHDI